jgi:hypothetical protein
VVLQRGVIVAGGAFACSGNIAYVSFLVAAAAPRQPLGRSLPSRRWRAALRSTVSGAQSVRETFERQRCAQGRQCRVLHQRRSPALRGEGTNTRPLWPTWSIWRWNRRRDSTFTYAYCHGEPGSQWQLQARQQGRGICFGFSTIHVRGFSQRSTVSKRRKRSMILLSPTPICQIYVAFRYFRCAHGNPQCWG